MKLVVHRALDQNRRVRRTVALAPAEIPELVSPHGNPEQQLLQGERRRVVWDAIQRLDPDHRTVVVLYYYQELSVAETAALLEIAEGTVKSRLHTARRRIESHLRASAGPHTSPLFVVL